MGNLFNNPDKKPNKLLDDDYYNDSGSIFFCCSSCITTNLQKNKWKTHFKDQCLLLSTYNVFWANLLPRMLQSFPFFQNQEEFQLELLSPKNIQWVEDRLIFTKQDSLQYPLQPSFYNPPFLSINQLNTSFEEEIDENQEEILQSQALEDPRTFEIYDTDSLMKGIFNLEEIHNSNGNKPNVRSYSNNLLLNKQWDQGVQVYEEKEVFNSLKYYQWATSIIEAHMNNEQNALCFLKKSFVKLFYERYKGRLERLEGKKVSFNELEDLHSDSVHELLQFIRVLQEILALYYDLNSIGLRFSKFCLFTKDNLKNFTTSLLLNDQFYYLIFALHKRIYRPHAKRFKKSFFILQQYDPEKFGVPPALCLNQTTIDFLCKNQPELFNNQKSPKNDENKPEFRSFLESSHEEPELIIGNDENRSKSENSLNESRFLSVIKQVKFKKEDSFNKIRQPPQEITSNQPYLPAIKTFQNLIYYRSPIHKLKIILKTLEKIEKCIEKFYEKLNLHYKKELAGDEIVTVFLYVVSRCKIINLYAHLKFIDNFATSNILNSKSGYYNATLLICVSHLEDMVGEGNEEEEEKRESFGQSIRSCLEEVNRKGIRL